MTTTMVAHAATSRNVSTDLDVARHLAALGVPVFVAYPDPEGETASGRNTGYRLPGAWESTSANPAYIGAWKPGMALCAVMGYTFDVLDTDPRNGADESMPLLLAELEGELPEVYGRVRTPSGGWHRWIAALGIGKHTNFLPGLDLQGERSFAFLPPTVRKSKADGVLRPYTWTEAPSSAPADDTSGKRLAGLIEALDAAKKAPALAGRTGTALSQGSAYGRMRGILTRLLEAQNGERNNLLFWASRTTGQLVAAGEISPDTAVSLLADTAAEIGLTEEDGEQSVMATIASGFRSVAA